MSDGFNLHNIDASTAPAVLTVRDCEAIGNDRFGQGSPAGDGVTAHAANHTIIVDGGTYATNGKSGAALVNGAELRVLGNAQFYGNGWSHTDLRDVFSENGHVEWLGGSTPRMTLSSATCAYRGGSIDSATLAAGEFHVYGFDFWQDGGVVGGSLDCWQPFQTCVSTYVEHLIPIPGDVDQSGAVNPDDVDDFAMVLIGLDTDPTHVCSSDTNCDDRSDGKDIAPFCDRLLEGR
jgi:hypothetical protein